ncbi:hypothetical protein F5Y14DRAFT_404200 [Nemania sp. NC0429]|nr:hypothetical protein F5Y14DRAFT_404200 [Nemania sp. NC0429]
MAFTIRTLAVALLLAFRTSAYDGLRRRPNGSDFDLEVELPGGRFFSTLQPPDGPVPIEDFLNGPPRVTLKNFPRNFTDFGAQFTCFFVYTWVRPDDDGEDTELEWPWIRTNQTLFYNQTLRGGVGEGDGRWPPLTFPLDYEFQSLREASINVFLQTPWLNYELYGEPGRSYPKGLLHEIWDGYYGKEVGPDFLHAAIDFSIYNFTLSNSTTNAAARPAPWIWWLTLCISVPLLATCIC